MKCNSLYITYTRVFTAIFINVNLTVIAWPNCTEMSFYQRSYSYVTWFTHLHFIAKHTNTNWTNTYIRVLREEVNVNDSEQRDSFLEVVHYVKQPIAVPTNHTRVRVGVTCIHFNKWVNYMVLGRLAVYSSTVISTCLFQEPLNCQNKRGKNTKLKQRQYVCDKFKM